MNLEKCCCLINRIAACVPSVGGDGIPPKERADSYGTTVYGPPEKTPQLAAGMLHVPSGDWRPGDMLALGIIFAELEIPSGKPKSISLLAEHDKKMFAQTTDRVIWHIRLAKKICYQRQRNWPTLMTRFQMNGSLQWIFFVA